ncbi:integrase catalytic domain-containing protein [Trichonephila clavata]|uniref:Integrase catalytic domain-containing protein n=1 Tax=Trichonephila clavata TaxID=2740835 RepID=A0A8X6LW95_TRICU|nr:integrase catalytic domain-containing protein [Trichonephila clavata]
MTRILGWLKRFPKNYQKKVVNQEPFLSVDEVQESRGTLLLLIQAESFPETGDSINGLLTVRDQSGLRRVKTKTIKRDDSYAFRYPVLLPSRHYIVDCLEIII